MRLISLIRKIDKDECNEMHFIIGYHEYCAMGAYMTSWHNSVDDVLKLPHDFLSRHVSSFWFRAKENTMLIELRGK